MEIILKAFNEDSFSHKGKYYTIPADVPYRGYQLKDVTLVPRPVEIWQPIASGRTLPYIAQKGIKGMVALTGEILAEQIIRTYQEESAKVGRVLDLGQDMALGIGFCIGDSQEAAINQVRPYHDERYKWFAPFGFVRSAIPILKGAPGELPARPWAYPALKMGCSKRPGSAVRRNSSSASSGSWNRNTPGWKT